jgi:thioesterase domain-containing protein/aryl carrier-like protein
MAALYGAFCEQRASPLPDLAVSYGDFAAWHSEWLRGSEFERQVTFWRARLARVGKVPPLPTDKARRPGMSGAGGTEVLRVEKPKVEELHELARKAGTTVYIEMLAAFCVLLYDYSRQPNLMLGTPVRGRNTVELEAIMGYFNNLLPMQIEIAPEEPFSELVARVRAAAVEIFAHPDVPLEHLSRELSTAVGKSGSVLYQALFSFQDARQRVRQWGRLAHSRFPVFQRGATEDLGMWFVETTEGLYGGVTFNTDLFERATVQALRDRYFAILDSVIAAPSTTVAALVGAPNPLSMQRLRSQEASAEPRGAPTDRAARIEPRTDAEKRIAEIWCAVLGTSEVGLEDNFFHMGGHSLMVVQLIQEINRKCKVTLGVPELFRNPTLRQMATLIAVQQPKSKRVPTVVPLQRGSMDPPVYFIYAGPDEIRLAQLMGGRHPTFGIEMPWPIAWRDAVAAERISGYPTMEQLAAPFAAALSSHAKSSPCVLAGHSFAGLIAFEVAHQMHEMGGKVELVVLLDANSRYPNSYEIALEKWKLDWGRPQVARLSDCLHTTWWLFRRELRRIRSILRDQIRKPPEQLTTMLDEQGMPLPWKYIERLYMKVQKPYLRRPLDCRGALFRAEPQGDKNLARDLDVSLGWNKLFSRGLDIVPVPGDHLTMIREHNPTLAKDMVHLLSRYWPDRA